MNSDDDWGDTFDDKDGSEWEEEFSGPDDDIIESQYERDTVVQTTEFSNDSDGYAPARITSDPEPSIKINTDFVLGECTKKVLSFALKTWNQDLLRILFDTGLSPDTHHYGSETPLMFALRQDSEALTKLLLFYGASVWQGQGDNYSIMRSALAKDSDTSKLIVTRALENVVEDGEREFLEDEPNTNWNEYRVFTGYAFDPNQDSDQIDTVGVIYLEKYSELPVLAMLIEYGLDELFCRGLRGNLDVFGLRESEPDQDSCTVYEEMRCYDIHKTNPYYSRYSFLRGDDPIMQVAFYYKQYRMGWILNEYRKRRLKFAVDDQYLSMAQVEELDYLSKLCEKNEIKLAEFCKDSGVMLPTSEDIFGA